MYYEEAFRVLEIAPTTDKKAIKKAYAALTRKHHPEECPQEWEEIRRVYDVAIRYAARQQDGLTDVDRETRLEYLNKSEQMTNRMHCGRSEAQDELGEVFENIEELSAEIKQKREDEQEESKYEAMKEVVALLQIMLDKGISKLSIWKKIFLDERYADIMLYEPFLKECAWVVDHTYVSRRVYKFLLQNVNALIRQMAQGTDGEEKYRIMSAVNQLEQKVRAVQEKKQLFIKKTFLVIVGCIVYGLFVCGVIIFAAKTMNG